MAMTNVVAYTALLYGRDYLASAIRSVIDAVDEYHILYTPIGSHGHRSDIPCPESRDELYEIARQAAGSKFRWHEATWAHEGQQRDSIHQYAPDADVILVVDADEVWSVGAVRYAQFAAAFGQYRRYRVSMWHYWRSFRRVVMHDPAFPVRVICPKKPDSETQLDCHYWDGCRIHHFGYAQRPEIVEYKQHVHGHRGEWRRDVDWFRERFMANAQHDCHPVGSEYWQPEPVDPFALGLPEWMREHPYAGLEVIE